MNYQSYSFAVHVKEKGHDDLGVKVGVPVGLSILWLLILAFTVAYLKKYCLQKSKSSAVEPTPDSKAKLGEMMQAWNSKVLLVFQIDENMTLKFWV